ncbi:MAG: NAD(P)H-hydrate dehydratase [Nitrospinaceae bacterium]
MQKIATASEMQAIDRRAIEEYGVPGAVLMENAGLGIFTALEETFSRLREKSVVVFSGKGNNGGDGFVVARHLFNLGAQVQALLLGKRSGLKDDALLNAEAADKLGIPISEVDESNLDSAADILCGSDIVIDAIFGTGLTKPASGLYERAIKKINQLGKYVVAVDIPSGIDSDTGQLMGPHVTADLTLTLGMMKRSHVLYPAAEAMGQVRLVDIGLPSAAVEAQPIGVRVPEEEDIQALFKTRAPDSHKGTYGHVLVIAGSRGKGGAAGLAALAALRAGCGLVTLALPESCQKALEFYPLEVMTVPVPETESGCMDIKALDLLLEHSRDKSTVAIGPGISTSPETVELLGKLLPAMECPLVIDADGLNCMEHRQQLLGKLPVDTVLTPHPKEMSRISGLDTAEIQKDRIGTASAFAREHSVCLVLKGAASVIADKDGTVCINPTGNAGMATGGSGDVLTGIIAGCIAQGMKPAQAAVAGTYLHGLAGDIYAGEQSETSLIAGDLLRTLPESLRRILP